MKLKCLNANCEHQCIIETTNTEMPNTCPWCDAGLELFDIVDEEPKQKTKTELPDWCKVGKWVYEKERKEYFKITKVDCLISMQNADGKGQYGHGAFADKCVQARLRPYNAEEMKALVGKVLKHDTGLYLVTAYENRWNQVKIESAWREEEELLERWTIDTMPCGVFEHLEDGEWVE